MKRDGARDRVGSSPGFLDREVEAQLKPVRRRLDLAATRRFLDREVEAQLKLVRCRLAGACVPAFPRPRGRGPIEASSPAGPGSALRRRFLDREVEAQLKHAHQREGGRPHQSFLDREVEAQLKLEQAGKV